MNQNSEAVEKSKESKKINGKSRIFSREFWEVDLLIYPKILFFVLLVAVNTCYTFRTRFFRDVFGIPAQQYGIIAAVLSFVAFASAPLWTYIADRFRCPKTTLLITTLCQGAAFFLFKCISRATEETLPQTIAAVIAVGSVINCFNGAVYPLMDRIIVAMLNSSKCEGNAKELYGRQRLWGTLGNTVIVQFMGYLIDKYSYDSIFPAVGISFTLFTVIGFFLIPSDRPKNGVSIYSIGEKKDPEIAKSAKLEKKNEKRPSNFESIGKLLSNPKFGFFLLIVLFNGVSRAIGSHFMANYIEDDLDGLSGDKTFVSLASNCGQAIELIFFFVSRYLVARFGVFKLMVAAQVSMIIRMGIHVALPVGTGIQTYVYIACLAEAFKGISFGCMTASGVMVAVKEAPIELQATAQGLFSGIYVGLAPSLAGLLGFWLLKTDVPLLPGETKDDLSFKTRRAKELASITGFFNRHQGLFKISWILAMIAFILLIFKSQYIDKKAKAKALQKIELEEIKKTDENLESPVDATADSQSALTADISEKSQ
ncbi:MFS general substrate transporter [Rozella allomycis CSF55]|uniref:MFS general substrate transporter n=1 Tax=Rozella allomycis (strain CSF55) TaxID=988480 RepID=A0A075AS24_ROZAC|nr:Major facilitator superfamily domain-containing protein [Rozella allomycis CSF55]RKP21302.1 MFS general substrate transporter [Rozella allomycis CSF55]|eukprot:EPZ31348.1 Major facilitator superfamily domain-containing protein [Rozella allomycis CSF55]